jgi:formylmethanofuran dehydrogenase subunit E
MKKKCSKCGMIRSNKDLVKLENDNYICFSCWNRNLKEKNKYNSNKTDSN